uniref:SSD domain-containing protein n=1 Tax=Angiostrongylus cantonensis TaxID=6313 RepID=A0A0K0DNU3_ANGCA
LGHCRIEVASCIIGMFSVAISAITMCSLLMTSGSLSSKVQSLVTAPITCLVLFEFATAMLLIIGVLIDAYYLMMPFIFTKLELRRLLGEQIGILRILSRSSIPRLCILNRAFLQQLRKQFSNSEDT